MRTILRFLHWAIFLLVALVAVVFVVQNRHPVEVSLWPFPFVQMAPLFAVIVTCILFGFLFGVLSAWLSGASTRRKVRELNRMNQEKALQISQLQKELAALRPAGASGSLPAPSRPGITHAA
jgi:putative membrane protein